jgi:hypothetical protein
MPMAEGSGDTDAVAPCAKWHSIAILRGFHERPPAGIGPFIKSVCSVT